MAPQAAAETSAFDAGRHHLGGQLEHGQAGDLVAVAGLGAVHDPDLLEVDQRLGVGRAEQAQHLVAVDHRGVVVDPRLEQLVLDRQQHREGLVLAAGVAQEPADGLEAHAALAQRGDEAQPAELLGRVEGVASDPRRAGSISPDWR